MTVLIYELLIYSVFFVCAVIFSVLINTLFLRFSRTLGVRNIQDDTIIRWGVSSKPAFGGISFYILFLLSIVSFNFFYGSSLSETEQILHNKQFLGLLLSVTIGFLMGLADDAYNTQPLLKFSAQVTCAIILIISDIYIRFFQNDIANIVLTIFWVVGIMNSVNMLDNMDAITTVVSSLIILCCILLILFNPTSQHLHLFMLLGVFAALIGFLKFNWYPSRMYMGDTGSQFLGVFLSAIGIIYFWNNPFITGEFSLWKKAICVGLIFIMPLVDTTVVVINRISKGKSPFIGGKDHTTHSLALMGLTERLVAILVMSLTGTSLLLVLTITYWWPVWNNIFTIMFIIYLLTVFISFYRITVRKHSNKPS